jgi:transcriptional regulator with XRE-family HTH domain
MAKTKVRPHPDALAELLKSRGITLTDAARDISRGTRVIDRKTLARIDRGDEVKLETLQKLANNLKVPITYFDPPVGSSVEQVNSQLEDSRWLNLLLHKVDVDDLARMIWKLWDNTESDSIHWKLNVDRVDDEAISLLEQFEDAVNDFCQYVSTPGSNSLRAELDRLKKTKHVASLLEDLAKHHLAVLGASYLSWQSQKEIDRETECSLVIYNSCDHIMLSIEGHPAHERREKVWQGTVPPKFAPWGTFVKVNGRLLETDPAVVQQMENRRLNEAMDLPPFFRRLNEAMDDPPFLGLQIDESGRFRVEGEQKDSNSEASSDSND